MFEKAYRFGASAIDELNRRPGEPRGPNDNFVFLMVGLVILLLIFYLPIILMPPSSTLLP
jgi:hypothetical protein